MRARSGTTSKARHKKVLTRAKGFRGRNKTTLSAARQRTEAAMQYEYRDRKNRKRDFRGLWIQRINAAVREHGMVYSTFINGLNLAGIELDRKVLSELAISEPTSFATICEQAKAALSKKAA
jgi:large subunit ribosomal protein L20